jgi:hypothetical protein
MRAAVAGNIESVKDGFAVLPNFHAREDAVHPVLIPPLHSVQMRPDGIFLTHALLRLQYRDFVVASVAFHPSPVLQGPPGQDLRGDRILTVHVAEKIDDMLGPRQQGQVALNNDAVETVIYKNQEALKELRKGFHRSPPLMFSWIPKSSVRATGGINQPALAGFDFLALGFQGRSPWL